NSIYRTAKIIELLNNVDSYQRYFFRLYLVKIRFYEQIFFKNENKFLISDTFLKIIIIIREDVIDFKSIMIH
ncbi:MAG TPA: hypothetical protein DEQ50_01040, partial [Lactobacillus sp.]|nr:hypothetical protein [Lactobacillus sp.]